MLVKLTKGNKLSDEEAKKVTAGGSIFCHIFLAMSDPYACGFTIDQVLMWDQIDSESIQH